MTTRQKENAQITRAKLLLFRVEPFEIRYSVATGAFQTHKRVKSEFGLIFPRWNSRRAEKSRFVLHNGNERLKTRSRGQSLILRQSASRSVQSAARDWPVSRAHHGRRGSPVETRQKWRTCVDCRKDVAVVSFGSSNVVKVIIPRFAAVLEDLEFPILISEIRASLTVFPHGFPHSASG